MERQAVLAIAKGKVVQHPCDNYKDQADEFGRCAPDATREGLTMVEQPRKRLAIVHARNDRERKTDRLMGKRGCLKGTAP